MEMMGPKVRRPLRLWCRRNRLVACRISRGGSFRTLWSQGYGAAAPIERMIFTTYLGTGQRSAGTMHSESARKGNSGGLLARAFVEIADLYLDGVSKVQHPHSGSAPYL